MRSVLVSHVHFFWKAKIFKMHNISGGVLNGDTKFVCLFMNHQQTEIQTDS